MEMKINKLRRRAKVRGSEGSEIDVNFFLREIAENHSGREVILDILNSKAIFISVERLNTNEVFFLNRRKIVCVELPERDLIEEMMRAPEIPVQVTLVNGQSITGSFFLEMPPERSRLSDYLNFSPQFIYLCRKYVDIIINKSYLFSVKE
jgi:hypothetical protein